LCWLIAEVGEVAERIGGGESRNHWWVAPTIGQAEMAYGRVKRMFRQAGVKDGSVEANDTKRTLNMRGAGVLTFKTGEEPDNLYGEDVWSVVMDEYTRQREEAWHALRSTITATGGRVRFIGNKRGRGWGWTLARFAEAEQAKGSTVWSAHRISALDAVACGLMSQDELEDARASMPENVFRELYLCEDTEDGSNPFGLGHIAACVAPLSLLPPVVFGIDLARSEDFTAVVGLDANGAVCRFDTWQGLSWDATESRILGIVERTPALVDSSGVGDPIVERLSRKRPSVEGFKFTGGKNGSKQQLMEGLALAIQTRKVSFPQGQIVNELNAYQYEYTRAGVTYSAPAGLHDDTVCALALAVRKREAAANAPRFFIRVGA
jgi:hypothetical protein